VYPPEAIRRRKIKAFRDWVVTLAELKPRPS
jgi:LysR family glycine cleavage system transcriptional activator